MWGKAQGGGRGSHGGGRGKGGETAISGDGLICVLFTDVNYSILNKYTINYAECDKLVYIKVKIIK